MNGEQWGCPRCGGHDSKIHQWGRDEDGYVIRIRDCTRPGCGGRFATEERVIRLEAFYHRESQRRDAKRGSPWYVGMERPCKSCGGSYLAGTYQNHCRSHEHVTSRYAKKREYSQRWRAAHPEDCRRYNLRYNERWPERRAAAHSAYRDRKERRKVA